MDYFLAGESSKILIPKKWWILTKIYF